MLYCTLAITLFANSILCLNNNKKRLVFLIYPFFVFYPINLYHYNDNVSIIKHMIQDPLEIYGAF